MSIARFRKFAPLSLLAVPLLIPSLVSPSNAAAPAKATKSKVSAPAKVTAKVTPNTSIPAAAHGVAFGTSLGTNTAATLKLFPNAKIGRVFWSSPKAQLPALPASYQIWVSFNTSMATVASGKFNAQFATLLQAWNKSGRTVYWSWQHEADRHASSSAAQFVAGWKQLLSVEAKNPSTRVKSMNILTGILLAPNKPHGDPARWYVNADVLGFDCYVPASIPRAMAYAKSKGKKWALPEFGADNGDAGNIAYIQSTIQQWASYPPIGAAWYNNTAAASFSQPLAKLPKTTAYLRTLASL